MDRKRTPRRQQPSLPEALSAGAERNRFDGKGDVVNWSRHYWQEQGLDGGEYLALFASFGRIEQIASRTIENVLKPFGLGLSRYLLLNSLLLTGDGSRVMNRLGWHMMVHPTTVTVVVDRLEKDRLVERKPHPTDRRATLVQITPSGRALTTEASKALAEARFGLPEMSPREIEDVLSLLTRIRGSLGDINSSDRAAESESSNRDSSAATW